MAELFATIMLQVSSILLSNEDTCAYRRVYLFNFLKKRNGLTAKAYRLIIKNTFYLFQLEREILFLVLIQMLSL